MSQLWLKINDISQAISPERSDSPDGSAAIYPPIGAVPVSRPGPEPVPVPVPVSDAKVFILGNEYVSSDTKSILGDIESKIWLTYRSGFEAIPKAFDGPSPLSFIHSMIFNRNLALTLNIHGLTDNENFTTDVGWGCMIRTSQSLLANALQILLLGRDYSYNDARGIEAGAPDSDSKNTLGESKNINTSESTSDTSGSGNFEVIAGTSLKVLLLIFTV